MPILRYVDPAGREQDVEDITQLQDLIQNRRIGYDSLIWDDEENRWTSARLHEFFLRIADIVASSPPQLPTPPGSWMRRWWTRSRRPKAQSGQVTR